MRFYVVFIGRTCGVHETWDSCKEATNKYPGSKFKGYESYEEAEQAWEQFEEHGTTPY